jgi:NhaP-type Na+/H+ or K+/H+ antiporter
MISILTLLYAFGKQLHLSTLLMIFIFGLVMNNAKIFFRSKLANHINFDNVKSIGKEFMIVTAETAFVVRTFFFITFGLMIDLRLLLDPRVLVIGFIILVILYVVRYLNFKVFLKTSVFPEIFLAPRGLITILLFLMIPSKFAIQDLSFGILFFVILGTSIIMMIAIMTSKDSEMQSTTFFDVGLGQASDYEIEYETFSEFDDLLDDVSGMKNKALENKDNTNDKKGDN